MLQNSSRPTSFFFFFNDTATTEIYTLSLHDALPISGDLGRRRAAPRSHAAPRLHPDQCAGRVRWIDVRVRVRDRKSTRLNSSHLVISYAVFCLKKKQTTRSAMPVSTTCCLCICFDVL